MAIAFDVVAESRRLDAQKPYIELIDGVEVPKVSPIWSHGRLQWILAAIIGAWSGSRGTVATEWRCWLDTGAEKRTSFVPDVSYVSPERWDVLDPRERELPRFAPDLAIEIRSPDDRERNIQRKITLYRQHGSRAVLDVRPEERVIVAHSGETPRVLRPGDVFTDEAFPGLRIDVTALFSALD